MLFINLHTGTESFLSAATRDDLAATRAAYDLLASLITDAPCWNEFVRQWDESPEYVTEKLTLADIRREVAEEYFARHPDIVAARYAIETDYAAPGDYPFEAYHTHHVI